MIAGALLVIGISAAALLASALLVQEESNGVALRAFNAQEQAARLWQLGLDPETITNILPERCAASDPPPAHSIHFSFGTNPVTTNVSGVVTVEQINPLRIVFHSGTRSDGTIVFRTNDIVVVRPAIR